MESPPTPSRPIEPAPAVGRLLALVDDESPRVWREVRSRLLIAGRRSRSAILRAARGPDARRRARARQLLLDRDRERAVRRLVGYAGRDTVDLEDGFFLLSAVGSPGLDVRPYRKALDAMGAQYRRRVDAAGESGDAAALLSEYLGDELGYAGPADDLHHPDNVLLHRAIERKTGLPLTLCALYSAVARRAGVSTGIVPLPGHVLLRVRAGGRSALVDPFDRGARRTEDCCLVYLAMHELPFRSSWFRDAEDLAMLRRQVVNLENSWRSRGLAFEVHGLARARRVLDRRLHT